MPHDPFWGFSPRKPIYGRLALELQGRNGPPARNRVRVYVRFHGLRTFLRMSLCVRYAMSLLRSRTPRRFSRPIWLLRPLGGSTAILFLWDQTPLS
jgi:hypothetical protein